MDFEKKKKTLRRTMKEEIEAIENHSNFMHKIKLKLNASTNWLERNGHIAHMRTRDYLL